MVVKSWIQRFQNYLAGNHPRFPGVVAAAVALGMSQLGYWQQLEQLGYNALFKIRPPIGWDEGIAVIAIDQASLQEYGQFPWPRARYTQLLQALKKSPPAAIGFDILFVAPSPLDAAMAQAIADQSNVVLSVAWDAEGKLLPPVPVLDKAAANVGHILHDPDKDGISRQATVFVESLPALAPAMLDVYKTRAGVQLALPKPVAGEKMPKVWINWPGTTQALPTYSFADIAEGRVDPSIFANKLVLIGPTATGIDPLRSPLNQNPPTSGVYLHAALIDNLLNKRLLQRTPEWADILLLLVIGAGTSWLLFNRQLKERVVIGFILPPAWFAVALTAFIWGNLWLSVAAPIGTILLAGLGVQLREQYEKQQLMNLFAQHVAPEMAEVIWERKEEIFENGELEAQELTATVLFMDIRGFTTISESLAPRELLTWLNLYLDAMASCIMEHGGVIDKYIGDAIMAVFGIPFPQAQEEDVKRDATAAIAASVAMHERLQVLNERFKEENRPLIRFGIGIHTGPVIAGTIGGAQRLSYSVLGDTVNVAARLEAMTKNLTSDSPYQILLTDRTFGYVSDLYAGQEFGAIQLRGKETETMVYSILGKLPVEAG
ncbi:adenylate/guanylate cyclase domain-containing protein [Microcoleus sp. FACHB-68]|uniref:CHASE2 domain-containing protein n=1 Tax=Microcoleus sp. FACHB-68 TaxID=2692826 RepID=UPI0016864C29|nr:adenylate/guanylate cyclase domain-containing protein [Microcoleus sp. FACHB-68]MBD1936247.1 adenylate/guanylate cyclase domain-containing protein [Microcoleus sp. FACHB-68]